MAVYKKIDGQYLLDHEFNDNDNLFDNFLFSYITATSVSSSTALGSTMRTFIIKNSGGATAYIGFDVSITTATGYPLEAARILSIDGMSSTISVITTTTSTKLNMISLI